MCRSYRFIKSLLIIFLLAACTPVSTQSLAAQPTMLSTENQSIAKTMIEQMAKGDYAALYSRFDANLQSMMSETQLKETWEQTTAQVGAFKKQVGSRMDEQQGHQIVTVTCQFEKALLDLKLGFNDKGQVIGLTFSQAQTGSSTESPYEIPNYVISGSFREKEVTLGSGEWAVPGTLSMPYCGSKPVPAIVLVHGSGPNDRNETIGPNQPFRDLAWGLASHCVAVLRYDKRTLTHATQFTPQVLASFTVQQEIIEDALLAVQLLRQAPGVDAGRIYLLGHSEGGMLATRIAQQDPGLAGLILVAAPSRPIEELALEQLSYISQLDGRISDQEKADLAAMKQAVARIQAPDLFSNQISQEYLLGASPAYWLDLRDYQPTQAVKTLIIPLLVLQGERDYQVLAAKDFAGWKAALEGAKNATLTLYPQLNHLMMPGEGPSTPQEYQVAGHVSQEVVADIIAWMGQKDQASQVPVQNGISLKVRTWFGIHLGNQVRSPMELSVAGPATLQSVTYLIDGTPMGTVQGAPVNYSFHSDDYAPGWHDLAAIGQSSDGTLLLSNAAHYRFLSPTEGNRILLVIAAGVLLLGLAIVIFQFGIFAHRTRVSIPLGTPREYGIGGGTICPKCGRPFSLRGFTLEILSCKLDRCPFCGEKGLFHRVSLAELRQAEAEELEAARPELPVQVEAEEQKLRRQVEVSRYDERI